MRNTPVDSDSPFSLREAFRDFLHEEWGVANSEYVVVLGTMALGFVFALANLGPRIARSFERSRDVVATPFP